MSNAEWILFDERLACIESKLNAYDIQIDEFVQNADISSAQWVEERLRALEGEIRTVRVFLGSNAINDMSRELEMLWKHIDILNKTINSMFKMEFVPYEKC
jgi:hypothetical protein